MFKPHILKHHIPELPNGGFAVGASRRPRSSVWAGPSINLSSCPPLRRKVFFADTGMAASQGRPQAGREGRPGLPRRQLSLDSSVRRTKPKHCMSCRNSPCRLHRREAQQKHSPTMSATCICYDLRTPGTSQSYKTASLKCYRPTKRA